MHIMSAVVLIGSALAIAPVQAHATSPPTETSFSYTSAPGDFLGGGKSGTYTNPPVDIGAGGTLGNVSFTVHNGIADQWSIKMRAPDTQQLRPGVYNDTEDAQLKSVTQPGLSVDSEVGCNDYYGSFTIFAISSDHLGNVDLLDAAFTVHCESPNAPPLTGAVKYNAPARSAVELTSATPQTVPGQPAQLNAVVANPSGGSVTFLDGTQVLGTAPVDANGFASFTTSSLAVGSHTLTATYGADASPVVQQSVLGGNTTLWFRSPAGDDMGGGASESFVNANSSFYFCCGLGRAKVEADSGDTTVYLEFDAPDPSRLRPGVFSNAASEPKPGSAPGIDIAVYQGDDAGCSTTGTFTINAISVDQFGTVTMLDATFSATCEVPHEQPMIGAIKYNAPPNGPVELSSMAPHTVFDEPATFSTRVSAPTGGAVTFADGSTPLGSASVDANGFAHLTTAALAIGKHSISASYKGHHSNTVVQTVVDNTNSFWFTGLAREYISGGNYQHYAGPADDVLIKGNTGSFQMVVNAVHGHHWEINIAAPRGQQLHTGTYTGTQAAQFRTGSHAGLDVSGDGRGCDSFSGQFTIKRISSYQGKIAFVDLTFSQICGGSGTTLPLIGEVHYGSTSRETTQTTLSAIPPNGHPSTPETFVAKVIPVGPPSTINGTVKFFDDFVLIGTGTLHNGVATLTTTLPAGDNMIIATYNGDSAHTFSSSAPVYVNTQ
jgi:hypothetical protein